MATVREIYSALEALIPRELSAPWDNDGLMVCADGDAEVKTVLLALDATAAVCAEGAKYDLIVTHHPLLFRKLGEVTEDFFVSKKVIDLIRSRTAVMSFHTRFDAMDGGMNGILANKLGLTSVEKFGDAESPTLGRIGEIAPISADALSEKIKKTLGAPFVLCADTGKPIKKLPSAAATAETSSCPRKRRAPTRSSPVARDTTAPSTRSTRASPSSRRGITIPRRYLPNISKRSSKLITPKSPSRARRAAVR